MNVCYCGHADDEHGGDPELTGSTACNVENCDCIAYEEEEDEDESLFAEDEEDEDDA